MKSLRIKRAQTTLEYAILLGVIVAGLIAMQVYLKRGYQGKLKEGADSMGTQFSPGYTTAKYVTTSFSNSTETLAEEVTVTTIHAQDSNRTTNESVQAFEDEYWWQSEAE
jgi:uncharacterized protein (UPF0333 family)